MQWIVVGDLEYPVFIKAGSIIPFLQVKESAMSLMQTIDANLRIEVFPNSNSVAKGALYLDDYQTHEYRKSVDQTVRTDKSLTQKLFRAIDNCSTVSALRLLRLHACYRCRLFTPPYNETYF